VKRRLLFEGESIPLRLGDVERLKHDGRGVHTRRIVQGADVVASWSNYARRANLPTEGRAGFTPPLDDLPIQLLCRRNYAMVKSLLPDVIEGDLKVREVVESDCVGWPAAQLKRVNSLLDLSLVGTLSNTWRYHIFRWAYFSEKAAEVCGKILGREAHHILAWVRLL
jgi:hypothetical protein